MAKALANMRVGFQSVFNQSIDAAVRKQPVRFLPAGRAAGQERNTLVDRADRINEEGLGGTSLDDVLPQHQVLNIRFWNKDALIAGEAAATADVEKSFYLFIDPTNGLNFAMLIDRARHRQILAKRPLGERRQEGVELRR